ncbi:steroid 17-alpha-hydroxylase/17,20 lyase isoform X2 [Magallana gigas]|uniref:steroid 17-alpha-hydroxylase/17,20 lyase isoform X2 n=1 Tax=Magallana gigas TaxID=29159 RepID=UPI0033425D04
MLTLSMNTQTILAGMSIGLFVYYVIKRMRYRLPPGPWCIPLVGHYKIYLSPEIHVKIAKLAKEYGPIVRLSVGPQTWVVLNDINSVLEAMVTKKTDFAGRPQITSGDVFTEGGKDITLANYSASWKLHRKIVGKALRNYLQGDLLENMIQDNMNKFLDKMAEEKGPFVFKEYMDLIIFHQLYTICFGEKRPVDDPEVKRFIKLDNDLLEKFGSGFFEDVFPYLRHIFTTAKWKKMLVLTEEVLNVLRKNLKEHKETFQPGVNRDFTDSMFIAKQEAKDEGDEAALEILDDTHLVQTISNIFFAGADTTRFLIDWFVYFMTRFPETQAKCQEEIDRVVGSKQLSMKDRGNLDYTEACIFETMRISNSVGFGIPHMTVCDSQVGGYDVPKGTTVLINYWALHHDPKQWKDPEQFDPHRFLDENGKMKPTKPDSWLPFSVGRRVCLGESLAKSDILLICANLLQRFEISLPEGVKPNLECHMKGFGMEMPPDYKIVVKERSG